MNAWKELYRSLGKDWIDPSHDDLDSVPPAVEPAVEGTLRHAERGIEASLEPRLVEPSLVEPSVEATPAVEPALESALVPALEPDVELRLMVEKNVGPTRRRPGPKPRGPTTVRPFGGGIKFTKVSRSGAAAVVPKFTHFTRDNTRPLKKRRS